MMANGIAFARDALAHRLDQVLSLGSSPQNPEPFEGKARRYAGRSPAG